MKAIRKSDGNQIEVEPYCPPQEDYDSYKSYPFEDYYITSDKEVLSNYDLDFDIEEAALPEKETAVIEGYVARDGNGDLYFYDHKPMRDDEDMDFVEQNGDAWFLHKGLNLPSVTWQSGPKCVRITIEEIEE